MKIKITVGLLIGLALLAAPYQASAQGLSAANGGGLCLPAAYYEVPEGCSLLGPSVYLTRVAKSGISLPIQELPSQVPDVSTQLPFNYAKSRAVKMSVFASAVDAAAGNPVKRYIESQFNFVTFIDYREIDSEWYYMIAPGEWVQRKDISFSVNPPTFVGIELNANPVQPFGWMLFPIESQRNPGKDNLEFTGFRYKRYDIVQVYQIREVKGAAWYLIAPDQWIEAQYAGLVFPSRQAPEGVEGNRWVEINLEQQTIAVYEDGVMQYATLTSSGLPGLWTRPGAFQITQKLEATQMSGAFEADRSDFYNLEDVPYVLYFDQSRAFHGTYWHNNFGYRMSAGCANLSPGDSLWLFNWAEVGDWVYVSDPSGKTPTDPSLYGAGGA